MERRSSRSKKPVNYKAFAGGDSDEEDFVPEPKRVKSDTDSADQSRTTKPAISKPPTQKKQVSVHRPTGDSDDDGRFLPEDEGLSESEPGSPEESDDDEFHVDESPSDDDTGSDFEPEAASKKKRTTPVKKKPVKGGAAKKSPKAGGRGRGSSRPTGKPPGRGRKDPSLSPARIGARQQQPRVQRLNKDNTVTSTNNNSTDKPLAQKTSSSSSTNTNIISTCSSIVSTSGSIRVGMSRNIKVKSLHPNIRPQT